MGGWLRSAGKVPDTVICSTARRARETWQLAQTGLRASPPVSYDDRVYDGSAAELLDLIRAMPPAVHTLLIVGHDPAIAELALTLAADPPPGSTGMPGSTALDDRIERIRAKFPTCQRTLASGFRLGMAGLDRLREKSAFDLGG